MRSRKMAGAFALLVFAAGSGFAEEPQLAYRILSGYVEKRQEGSSDGRRIGGVVTAAAGGLMVGAAAGTWFLGDEIATMATGSPMDPGLKLDVSLGLGIGGLVTAGVGAGIMLSKPRDWRAEYGEVFAEADPAVQEALAVAVLSDLAYDGRRDRIRGALVNLLAPLVSSAIRVGINLSEGREWGEGVMEGFYWNAFSIVGGVSDLFGTSEGERLYQKYLAGREALYGPPSLISTGRGN